MVTLKRDSVKYIRDQVKSRYKKADACAICGTDLLLEFHHYTTLTLLYRKWLKTNKLNENDVLEHRDTFIDEFLSELLDDTATLCKEHHAKLHKIYGKAPPLSTAAKQPRWVEKQRIKWENK